MNTEPFLIDIYGLIHFKNNTELLVNNYRKQVINCSYEKIKAHKFGLLNFFFNVHHKEGYISKNKDQYIRDNMKNKLS